LTDPDCTHSTVLNGVDTGSGSGGDQESGDKADPVVLTGWEGIFVAQFTGFEE